MAELPDDARSLCMRQDGAASGGQLRLMLGAGRLTRSVEAGRLVRLWRDAYVLPERADNLKARLRAADLTLGHSVVPCLHTAAALRGFDLTGDSRLHVLATDGATYSERAGLVLHRQHPYGTPTLVGDRLVLDAAETALRVACTQDPPHALAAMDAAVRSGVDAGQFEDLAARMNVHNIVRVRSLIPWVDGLAESPGESWLRWVILDAGLPTPTPQFWVKLGPNHSARLDLAWPDRRVACEYDGVAFHTGEQLFADRVRMNALTASGWTVLHVTAAMVFSGRADLVHQLARHLA